MVGHAKRELVHAPMSNGAGGKSRSLCPNPIAGLRGWRAKLPLAGSVRSGLVSTLLAWAEKLSISPIWFFDPNEMLLRQRLAGAVPLRPKKGLLEDKMPEP